MAEPTLLLPPGAPITDRMVVVRHLGSGGLGAVYEVEHRFTRHHRAVKVLHHRFRADRDITDRLLREASAAGRIGNPHIVETFDAGHLEDGSPYLVMELIEGRPLSEVLRWNGRLDAGLAAALMVQVCNAVQAAHDAGVIHRDLKPDNLFLTEREGKGFTKVLDFGVSKFSREEGDIRQTSSGITMGTPLYMAPEQLKGAKNADARSDVYSLGVILFEMLSGHVPFAANSFAELAVKVLSEALPPLAVKSGGIPDALAAVVNRALAKEPEGRFQTAREMAQALEPFAQNHEIAKLLEPHPELHNTSPPVAESVPLTPSGPHEDTYRPPKKPGDGSLRPFLRLLGGFAALGLAGAFLLWVIGRPTPSNSRSIAVLPFTNDTGDGENDYLSEGLSESVIYQLSRASHLKVMPRSSAARAKQGTATPVEAGQKLGVDAVLTAELAPRNVVRAELIDVRTGTLLWGNRWDRGALSLIMIQQQLAEGTRAALEKGEQRAAVQQPSNPAAYDAYLKGRYFWNKRTAEGLEKAAALFREALDQDPAFALAWVGLADSVALMDQYAGIPSGQNCPKAKAAVAKALELDDKLASAHASRALLLGHCDFLWPEAQTEFERALELDPNYATAHQWFALHLGYRARFERAMSEARSAEQLDPLSLIAANAVSVVGAYAGKWDVTLEQSDRLIALDSTFAVARIWKGRALRAKGDFVGARAELEKAYELTGGRWYELVGDLGAVAALAKDTEGAAKWKGQLEDALSKGASTSFQLAAVCASLGETEQAFAHLDRAFEQGSWFISQLRVDPLFDPLRKDPRFEALLKRAHLE